MKKLGWKREFIAHLSASLNRDFIPGQSDCMLTMAEGVSIISGVDHAEPFRGKYSTIREGIALLREAGYSGPVNYIEQNFVEVGRLHAEPGDIAILDDPDGKPAFGIVQGENVYVIGETGRAIASLTRIKRAFRV